MRTGCILLACVVFGTVASCFSPCIAETLPPNSGPIQAELVGKIDAGRAKIGDAVYANADDVFASFEAEVAHFVPIVRESGRMSRLIVQITISLTTSPTSPIAIYGNLDNPKKLFVQA